MWCVLFSTVALIEPHFREDPPPTIRLLTPKANPGTTQNKLKSKGCAFLEFTHRNALQQALKLHQSNLEGRLINVELTAGGGGKSDSRLAKVRERNKALLGQRVSIIFALHIVFSLCQVPFFRRNAPIRRAKLRLLWPNLNGSRQRRAHCRNRLQRRHGL